MRSSAPLTISPGDTSLNSKKNVWSFSCRKKDIREAVPTHTSLTLYERKGFWSIYMVQFLKTIKEQRMKERNSSGSMSMQASLVKEVTAHLKRFLLVVRWLNNGLAGHSGRMSVSHCNFWHKTLTQSLTVVDDCLCWFNAVIKQSLIQ